MDQLLHLLRDIFSEQALISLTLSAKRKKSQPCEKCIIRPVSTGKKGLFYQTELFYGTKVSHQNFDSGDMPALLDYIRQNLYDNFKQAHIFSTDADYQVLSANPEHVKIIKKPPVKTQPALSHNRIKQYVIADNTPCDFLIRLGVMSAEGKVFKAHYNKFRQINRFLEIVSDVLESLPRESGRPLHIIDFGCGKAYLTFALYHYLHDLHGFDLRITGLDLKEDVIHFCNAVASDLGYSNLTFELGDIAGYQPAASSPGIDMVVTLHACDTATDEALINAAAWDAKIILSVPCCQHELMGQIKNDLHRHMFKHGILKERFAALLTDSLRALKLEEAGYEVSLIEFTSLEHTAKNIMIRVAKPAHAASDEKKALSLQKARAAASAEYEALCAFWQVTPSIGRLRACSASSTSSS